MSDDSPTHIPYDVWVEIAKRDTTRTLPVTCSALASVYRHEAKAIPREEAISQGIYVDRVLRVECGPLDETVHELAACGVRFPDARKLKLVETRKPSTTAELDTILSVVCLNTLESLHIYGKWELCESLLRWIDPESCKLASLRLRVVDPPLVFSLPSALVARLTTLRVSFCICVSPSTLHPNIQFLSASHVCTVATEAPRDTVRCFPQSTVVVSSECVVPVLKNLIDWYPHIQVLYAGTTDLLAPEELCQSIPRLDLALARGGCNMPVRVYEEAAYPGVYMRGYTLVGVLNGGKSPADRDLLSQLLASGKLPVHPQHVIDNIRRLAHVLHLEHVYHVCAPVISSPGVPKGARTTSVYKWTSRRARAFVELASEIPEVAMGPLLQDCVSDIRTGHLFALRVSHVIMKRIFSMLLHSVYDHARMVPTWFVLLKALPSRAFEYDTTSDFFQRLKDRLAIASTFTKVTSSRRIPSAIHEPLVKVTREIYLKQTAWLSRRVAKKR